MAVTSGNGWPVIDTAAGTTQFTAGGRTWRAANTTVAAVARYFLERYATEVEAITGGTLDDWSWAVRNVRDSATTVSNHASATAWDVNALDHVRGKAGTFTPTQLAALRALLEDFPVLRWGGDYKTAPVDAMHFELNVTPAGLRAWCATGALDAVTFDAATGGVTYHPAATRAVTDSEELDMDEATFKRLVWEVLGQDDVLDAIADRVLTRSIHDPVTGSGYGLADRVTGLDRALNVPITSRVKGSSYKDVPAGYAANADAYGYQIMQTLSGMKSAVETLAQGAAKADGVTPDALTAAVESGLSKVVRVKASVQKETTA